MHTIIGFNYQLKNAHYNKSVNRAVKMFILRPQTCPLFNFYPDQVIKINNLIYIPPYFSIFISIWSMYLYS